MTDIPADLPARIAAALGGEPDLDAFHELLAPNAQWGPPEDPEWGCHNRNEIIAWYTRSRDRGMRGDVIEVVTGRGAILVGMRVRGTDAAADAGEPVVRWQVLTIQDGKVADIRGFDDRTVAAARAGVVG